MGPYALSDLSIKMSGEGLVCSWFRIARPSTVMEIIPNEGQRDSVDLMNGTFLNANVIREGLHVLHEIPVLPHFKISEDVSCVFLYFSYNVIILSFYMIA